MRFGGLQAAIAAAAVAALAAPASARAMAVTYQADNAHTGNVADGPNPPLGIKWIRRDLGDSVSYPVVAGDRVYVTAHRIADTGRAIGPTLLYALDRRTGGTVWVREVASAGQPAYGDGRVYVEGTNALDAVSAATGERVWRHDLGGYAGPVPVAEGALVYASDGRGAYAISSDTGLTVQTVAMPNSGFAVGGERVFVAQNGCRVVSAYPRTLSEPIWTRTGPCSTSAQPPPAFDKLSEVDERLWARDAGGQVGLVIDALTSLGTEQFGSRGGVAFAGALAFLRRESSVEARDAKAGTIKWQWGPGEQLYGSALAVRDAVWVTTAAGRLVALRSGDGAELFSTQIGVANRGYIDYDTSAPRGMAADADGLIVPLEDRLVALGPGGDTPGVTDPDKIPAGTTKLRAAMRVRDLPYLSKASVTGFVQQSDVNRPSHDLELQADPYPYGVWEPVARSRSNGEFTLRHAPDRNTRYRVVDTSTAPALISKTFQAYVYPHQKIRTRGLRRAVRVTWTAVVPPYLDLAGRRAYIYRGRTPRAVFTRAASTKLKRVAPNTFRASGTARAPGNRGYYFFVCTKLPAGLLGRYHGRKDPCGRRRY